MYSSPKPTLPENEPSALQGLIDNFMGLGFEVKEIHALMKLLSIILNLDVSSIGK
jgi:hypothetical protein